MLGFFSLKSLVKARHSFCERPSALPGLWGGCEIMGWEGQISLGSSQNRGGGRRRRRNGESALHLYVSRTDGVHIQTTPIVHSFWPVLGKIWSRGVRGVELGQTHCVPQPPLKLTLNKNTWGKTLCLKRCQASVWNIQKTSQPHNFLD